MKEWIIVAIVIVILVIGGIFLFTGNKQTSSNYQTPSSQNQTQTQSNSNPQTQNTAEVDCGTTGPLSFSGTLSYDTSFNDAQKQAWSCMTDALAVCNKAKTVLGTSTYKVLGKQNNLCQVYGPSLSSSGDVKYVTCGLSQKVIGAFYAQAEQKYPNIKQAKAFNTFNIVTAGGGTIPFPDGSETVVCS